MKKVRVFMIVSVVLILMSTITFAILYHQPDLEYQTIHGDVSALQNIKVNMKINTQMRVLHLKREICIPILIKKAI